MHGKFTYPIQSMLQIARIKSRLWIILFAFVSIPSLAGSPITICTGDFPPYNSHLLPQNGPVIEIATEAFRRSGYPISVQFMPWARILKEGERSQCAILGIWRSPERDLIFNFSQPITQQELGFFARQGTPPRQQSQLNGLTIGIERSTYLSPQLQDSSLHFDLAPNLYISLLKLANKRVDLAYGDKAAGLYMIKNEAKLHNIVWYPPRLESKQSYLAFAKSYKQQAEILQAFNQGLDSMKADGSFKKILSAAGLDPR